MSGSSWEGKQEIELFMRSHRFSSLLDIGPGRGVYGLMARAAGVKFVFAVEIFKAYAEVYYYKYIYDRVIFGDFSKIELPEADVIVIGDVLEHLAKPQAIAVMTRIKSQYKNIVLSVPIGLWPQGPSEGNVFETHLSTWAFDELAQNLCKDFSAKYMFTNTSVGVFLKCPCH